VGGIETSIFDMLTHDYVCPVPLVVDNTSIKFAVNAAFCNKSQLKKNYFFFKIYAFQRRKRESSRGVAYV